MEKMDEITRQLAAQQPLLNDADALTNSIMDHLPPQARSHDWQVLRTLRWISSVAAIGLLILFINQNRGIIQRQNDVDYGTSLQQLRSEHMKLDVGLPPREALRQFVDLKRDRMNISDIKRHFTLEL